MFLHPHLASMPLKRTPLARDTRAPREPSIVDWLCRLPSLECVAGSVAPGGCPLVRGAARGRPATIREAGQNDSRHATTPGGPTGVETAVLWPRYGGPAPLFHGGRSDSPVR